MKVFVLLLLGIVACFAGPQCPDGTSLVACKVDPCMMAKCEARPDAKCRSNYCGGCNFDFYEGGQKLSREDCYVY